MLSEVVWTRTKAGAASVVLVGGGAEVLVVVVGRVPDVLPVVVVGVVPDVLLLGVVLVIVVEAVVDGGATLVVTCVGLVVDVVVVVGASVVVVVESIETGWPTDGLSPVSNASRNCSMFCRSVVLRFWNTAAETKLNTVDTLPSCRNPKPRI